VLVAIELTAILLLVLVNGYFAAAEIALLTAGRGKLKPMADRGDRRAASALSLLDHPDRLLSTVQVGITLVSMFAAVFGGVRIVRVLETFFAGSPLRIISANAAPLAMLLFVPTLSFLSIVFGELVPKRIAMHKSVAIARAVAPVMQRLQALARPIVWTMSACSESVLRLVGFQLSERNRLSLQDIQAMIDQGRSEGVIDSLEQRLAVGAIQLGDKQVRHIMRSRVDVDAADIDTPTEEVVGVVSMAGFSRLPVYEHDLDHILGYVQLKDVLQQHYMGWPVSLRKLVRTALFVPESMPVDVLLQKFQDSKHEMAVVVDELGSTAGLVTRGDILRALVRGVESGDDARFRIVKRQEGGWLVDGSVTCELFLSEIQRPEWIDHIPRQITTVAGLVLYQLGRFPAVGECCTWQGLRIEVVDLDGKRIDRLLVTLLPGR
jgi:putative hemolysin